MTNWDNLVEPTRDALEALLRKGDEMADRIEELEAKLGRAEWLLCDAMVQLRDGKIRTRRNRAGLIEAFLEELKGQNNE
jgi:hypothetical protein